MKVTNNSEGIIVLLHQGRQVSVGAKQSYVSNVAFKADEQEQLENGKANGTLSYDEDYSVDGVPTETKKAVEVQDDSTKKGVEDSDDEATTRKGVATQDAPIDTVEEVVETPVVTEEVKTEEVKTEEEAAGEPEVKKGETSDGLKIFFVRNNKGKYFMNTASTYPVDKVFYMTEANAKDMKEGMISKDGVDTELNVFQA